MKSWFRITNLNKMVDRACGPFTKNKKSKETGDTKYTYRNELDKASHKVLINKAFNIAKNPKRDGYQRGLSSMVYKFSL